MKQLKTIKLKGKDYVQVNERVLFFNETYPNGAIKTIPTFQDDTVYFKAVVTPDIENSTRYFVGHSFGNVKAEKALEKLETVAVGRALAFMGIGIVESIASADEIANFQNKESLGTCSTCGAEMARSKAGNLYCPKSYTAPEHKSKPTYTKNEEEFLESLPE